MTRSAARAAGEIAPAVPPLRLMIVDDSQVARAVLSRMLAAYDDFGQRLEAALARHLDVEKHDIDLGPGQQAQRLGGVGGGGDDLEIGEAGEHPGEHGPRHLRIVDDHQPQGRRGWSCLPRRAGGGPAHATPTICSLLSSVSRSKGFITYSSAPASIAARM